MTKRFEVYSATSLGDALLAQSIGEGSWWVWLGWPGSPGAEVLDRREA